MGAGYLVDTNVVIGYLDNKLPAHGMSAMHAVIDERPIVSVITKIEVLRFNAPEQGYQVLVNFINDSTILDLSDVVVNATIAICKAHKIKLPDAIIAATAIVYDLTLITAMSRILKT